MRLMFTAVIAATMLAPVAPAAAQTLEQALADAYRTNPNLRAARLSARATDESLAQARAAYLPQLSLSASAGTRETQNTVSGVDFPRQTLDPQSASVQASQQLYTGGRRDAVRRLALARIDTERERLRATEQQVLLQVIAAYVTVQRDQEVVAIRRNNVDVLTRQLQAAEDRFEVGEITRTDVAQARARLAGAEAGLAGALAALESSRADYIEVVGSEPVDLAAPPEAPILPQDLALAVNFALEASPNIRIAEGNTRAARQQTRIERAELLPQIGVSGSYGVTRDFSSADTEQESAAATASLSIPLFEGGFARSRTRQARIVEQQARANRDATERSVLNAVTAAWNDVLASRRVIEASREQVEANELAFEGVQQEQLVGLRTTLDVLNAEQELLESRVTLVTAQRDAYIAAHSLLAAIGALDAETLSVNAPLYDPAEHTRAVRGNLLGLDPPPAP